MLQDFKIPASLANIAYTIRNGTCVLVTNRSYDPVSKLTTSCWVIEGNTSRNQAEGASQTNGYFCNKDSYRGELYGIYCILICIDISVYTQKIPLEKLPLHVTVTELNTSSHLQSTPQY